MSLVKSLEFDHCSTSIVLSSHHLLLRQQLLGGGGAAGAVLRGPGADDGGGRAGEGDARRRPRGQVHHHRRLVVLLHINNGRRLRVLLKPIMNGLRLDVSLTSCTDLWSVGLISRRDEAGHGGGRHPRRARGRGDDVGDAHVCQLLLDQVHRGHQRGPVTLLLVLFFAVAVFLVIGGVVLGGVDGGYGPGGLEMSND